MSEEKPEDGTPVGAEALAESLRRKREAQEAIGREIKRARGPAFEYQRDLARIHESFRTEFGQIDAIVQVAGEIANSAGLEQLRRVRNDLARAMPSPRILEEFTNRNLILAREWSIVVARMRDVLDPLGAASYVFDDHFARMTEMTLMGQAHFAALSPERVGSVLGVAAETNRTLAGVVSDVTASYATLISSLGTDPRGIGSFDPVVSGLPPIGYYTSGRIGRAVSDDTRPSGEDERLAEEIQRQSQPRLETLLAEVDPELCKLLRGARQALESDNVDRVRHFASSLRELFTHTLRLIAPDDAVSGWTSSPEHFHDKRPTRGARVLYVCRKINHGPFESFVSKEVAAKLAFIDLFHQGTHEVSVPFNELQLQTMLQGMETLLLSLLELWKR